MVEVNQEPHNLNALERDIIALLADGLTTRRIAKALHRTTEATVETYRTRLFTRLGLKNSCHLVAWAYRTGVLTDVPAMAQPETETII